MKNDILLQMIGELDLKYNMSVLKYIQFYQQQQTFDLKNTRVLSQTMKNIDSFLKMLDQYDKITPLNRCKIGLELLKTDTKIGDMLYSEKNIEDLSNNENLKYMQKIVELSFNKIDIEDITESIKDTKIYLINNENRKPILLNDENELIDIIIEMIYRNDFAFGDVLYDFLSEVDLNTIFYYANPHYKYKVEISDYTIFNVLNFLNYFTFRTFILFERNEKFLREFLINNFFDSKFNKIYFLGELSNEKGENSISKIDYLYAKNFKAGILKTKNLYYIKSGMNDNRYFKTYSESSTSQKLDDIKKMCKHFSDDTICNIFYLSYFKDKELTKLDMEKIDKIVEDISCSWRKVRVVPNDVSQKEVNIVKEILDHIENFKKELPNLVILDLKLLKEISKDSMTIKLATCNMNYKEEKIKLDIKKSKGSLYYYLYLNNREEVKERILTVNDYLRIEYQIKEVLCLG